ncbi:hypothetical protein CYR55_22975 [Chimaeribacter californicus]|uniref:Uncharacterized protein n=1 Tax=Chimaeribacter californicus TaxID=2060067 RepID=A0A2N5DSQ2_9GAMM|nr:hypothetical protein [Chimaeribacter californicus]PLR29159.1 hypothetical protein CYR55_22975 [Chimaeribacter californicus]
MSQKLTLDAMLFWIFEETKDMRLTKAADGSAQLAITDKQDESHTFSGTLANVVIAAYTEISPDAEQDAHTDKVRDLCSKLTFGLFENSLQHQAHQALYETVSS